ncbi:MAG: hypothetical protein WC121_13500 [Candidatus Kapaibacterium sp.]
MRKYKNILSDIIQDKSNWTDLKLELSKYNIDNRVAEDMDAFHEVLADSNFVLHYGGFAEAEKHKRIPKELQLAAEEEPLIFNKAFYFISREEIDFDDPRIVDIVMIKYLAAKPVTDWLINAIG